MKRLCVILGLFFVITVVCTAKAVPTAVPTCDRAAGFTKMWGGSNSDSIKLGYGLDGHTICNVSAVSQAVRIFIPLVQYRGDLRAKIYDKKFTAKQLRSFLADNLVTYASSFYTDTSFYADLIREAAELDSSIILSIEEYPVVAFLEFVAFLRPYQEVSRSKFYRRQDSELDISNFTKSNSYGNWECLNKAVVIPLDHYPYVDNVCRPDTYLQWRSVYAESVLRVYASWYRIPKAWLPLLHRFGTGTVYRLMSYEIVETPEQEQARIEAEQEAEQDRINEAIRQVEAADREVIRMAYRPYGGVQAGLSAQVPPGINALGYGKVFLGVPILVLNAVTQSASRVNLEAGLGTRSIEINLGNVTQYMPGNVEIGIVYEQLSMGSVGVKLNSYLWKTDDSIYHIAITPLLRIGVVEVSADIPIIEDGFPGKVPVLVNIGTTITF